MKPHFLPVIALRLAPDGKAWEIAAEVPGEPLQWLALPFTSAMLPETAVALVRKRFPGVAIKYPG